LFEDPTYFLARGIFLDHSKNFTIMPVSQDEQGLNVDDLEAKLKRTATAPGFTNTQFFPFMLYLVSTFNNPTSRTLSLERRRKLIALAYKYNILIVTDDVYDLLNLDDNVVMPPRLVSLDQGEGRVISNCSFSKIYGPGTRCGWMEITGKTLNSRIKAMGVLASGGSVNHFTSTFLFLPAMKHGYMTQVIVSMRQKLKARRDAMLKAMDQHLEPFASWTKPSGGYFVWLTVKGDINTVKLRDECIRRFRVGYAPGMWFSPISGSGATELRLCYAFYPEDRIQIGIERLGQFLKANLNL
jgi:DNA-binding transcriptional MocR family regulator